MIVAAERAGHLTIYHEKRGAVTGRLNAKIIRLLADNGVDVIDAEAHFVSNKVIEIQAGDEKKK